MRRTFGVEGVREVADEALQSIGLEQRRRRVEKRRCDITLAGLDHAAYAKPRGLEHVGGVGRVGLEPDQVLLAADRRMQDRLAVEQEVELVWILETADRAQVRAIEPDLELYSPSTGNVCLAVMPPTVPSGKPSRCTSCDRSCRTV